jgi:tetratricopeptide (TPR) repeat protein
MNRLYLVCFISFILPIQVLANGSLSKADERKAKDCVMSYYNLVSEYCADPNENIDCYQEILSLFVPKANSVYDDIAQYDDGLRNSDGEDVSAYLQKIAGLYNRKDMRFNFKVNPQDAYEFERPVYKENKADIDNPVSLIYVTVKKSISSNLTNTLTCTEVFRLKNWQIERICPVELSTMDAEYFYNKHDYKTAYKLFTKAAESGDDEAQYRLGMMLLYARGCGDVPKRVRDKMCVFWLDKCVEGYAVLNYLNVGYVPADFSGYKIPFSEDLMVIYEEKHGNQRFGFMNNKGKNVIPCVYTYVEQFNHGIAIAKNEEGRYGVIDKYGLIVVPFEYTKIEPDYNGGMIKTWNGDFNNTIDVKDKMTN